ncbi:hypothetical protein [Chitinophaga rhizophila]|uniref:Uncharacterized protein n=1 Tax=Chitinophaga rhizophila TaxID=2866212 RepID=A0ABS7GCY3_9BACT|nr:hypothetical protein [Chitinophaga rhizophila]MBW8685527.1 hypothetical protein [Chitinophaga rhizophila]
MSKTDNIKDPLSLTEEDVRTLPREEVFRRLIEKLKGRVIFPRASEDAKRMADNLEATWPDFPHR